MKWLDEVYLQFKAKSRSFRSGSVRDEFNYRNSNHSTCPVILVLYNLPNQMCAKEAYFMIPVLIPGRKLPKNDMQLYQPFLKDLWIMIQRSDVSQNETSHMHATLLWSSQECKQLSYETFQLMLSSQVGVEKEYWHAYVVWMTLNTSKLECNHETSIYETSSLFGMPSLPT